LPGKFASFRWLILFQPGRTLAGISRALGEALSLLEQEVFYLDISDLASEQIILQARKIQPRLILSPDNLLNHPLQNHLEELLAELKAWYLCWFVDHPFGFNPHLIPRESSVIFCWDSAYLDQLKKFTKIERIYHLPLAGENNFKKKSTRAGWKVSFLGSLSYQNSFLDDLLVSCPELFELAEFYLEKAKKSLSQDRLKLAQGILSAKTGDWYQKLEPFYQEVVKFALGYYADKQLRKALAEASPFRLTVFGDEGWKELGEKIDFQGAVDYSERFEVYSKSELNLNLHQSQCRNGLNQRVYEVPLAGGFLITDFRAELEGFDNKNWICYKSFQELKDLIFYWLKKPRERMKIINSARKEIISSHLFLHRGEKILEILTGEIQI